jgi:hypothetical protein
LSHLYLANVLAAVAGATVPLLLIELFGFLHTLYAGAALNFSLAAGAFGLTLTHSGVSQIHPNIASVPVAHYAEADRYKKFFWVTLPEFDALPVSVTAMPRPGRGWCEQKQFTGGTLFT